MPDKIITTPDLLKLLLYNSHASGIGLGAVLAQTDKDEVEHWTP